MYTLGTDVEVVTDHWSAYTLTKDPKKKDRCKLIATGGSSYLSIIMLLISLEKNHTVITDHVIKPKPIQFSEKEIVDWGIESEDDI